MSRDPLLDVTDLSVGFDGFDGYADVVGNVDLRVDRGEVVTIVGETGCGKSVTTKPSPGCWTSRRRMSTAALSSTGWISGRSRTPNGTT